MSWTDRALAARELQERVKKKPVRKQPVQWKPPPLKHSLTLELVDNRVGEIPVYIAHCRCGWESAPKSQVCVRDDYYDHADNLWEVAS